MKETTWREAEAGLKQPTRSSLLWSYGQKDAQRHLSGPAVQLKRQSGPVTVVTALAPTPTVFTSSEAARVNTAKRVEVAENGLKFVGKKTEKPINTLTKKKSPHRILETQKRFFFSRRESLRKIHFAFIIHC